MFPRAQRLRKSEEIIVVLRKGRRVQSGSVTCSFLRKAGNLSRVTVIVDTKVSKQSTVRNLLKRRVRAYLHSVKLPLGSLLHPGEDRPETNPQQLSALLPWRRRRSVLI